MDNIEEIFKKCVYLFQNGNKLKAINQLKNLLEINKNHFDSNSLLGVIFASENKFVEAEFYFNTAKKLRPLNKSIMYNLALVQQNLKKYNDAIINYKKVIELDINYCYAYNNLANIYFELFNYEQAEFYIQKSLKLDKKNPLTYNILGNIYYQNKRFTEALDSYNDSLEIENNPLTLVNKSKVLVELEDINSAIKILIEVVEKNPDNQVAMKELIKNYIKINDFKKAEELIIKQLIKIKIDSELYYIYGIILSKKNNYDLSIINFSKAILINENSYDSLLERSLSYRELGEYSKAIDDLIKLISSTEIKILLIKGYINLGILYQEVQNFDSSFKAFNEALKMDLNNKKIKYNISQLELQNKIFESGFKNYKNRININDLEITKYLDSIEIWNGTKDINSLLILAEQGLGDQIFYLTHLEKIKIENITVALDKRLIDLFNFNYPRIKFIDINIILQNNYQIKVDAQILMCDLMQIVIKNIVPNREVFNLMPNNNLEIMKIKESNIDKKIIGISWNSKNKLIGKNKSIDIHMLVEYLYFPNITFISLQYEPELEDINKLTNNKRINFLDTLEFDLKNNIYNLFHLINTCDLIITTSNINAHISGLLGKQTWVLVPENKGRLWYWHNDINSQWYKKCKIFFYKSHTICTVTFKKINTELMNFLRIE